MATSPHAAYDSKRLTRELERKKAEKDNKLIDEPEDYQLNTRDLTVEDENKAY